MFVSEEMCLFRFGSSSNQTHTGQKHSLCSVLTSITITRVLKRFSTKISLFTPSSVDPGLSADEAVSSFW